MKNIVVRVLMVFVILVGCVRHTQSMLLRVMRKVRNLLHH